LKKKYSKECAIADGYGIFFVNLIKSYGNAHCIQGAALTKDGVVISFS
jgi:hypothetical protein